MTHISSANPSSHEVANMPRGTLYGIGIGPGDPELLTLKAAKQIATCAVVSYIQNPEGYSLSRDITADHLTAAHIELPITFRMSRDRSAINQAYDEAAKAITEHLEQGRDVAMLCEGDPLFYGSFNYLLERLKDHQRCQVIPGINSVQAVAAATAEPLIQQDQSLMVMSSRNTDQQILSALAQQDAIAILKAGPQRPRLLELIRRSGRWLDGCYVTRASQLQQQVYLSLDQLPDEPGDYFGLLLIRPRRTDPPSSDDIVQPATELRPLIISLTEQGAALAESLTQPLNAEHWHKPQPFQNQVQQAFASGRRLLLITATGIAMRTLAPTLKDKYQDPAVLVLDERGQFVIPLLSGHEGGANHWASEVAALTQGQAIITSARQYLKPFWIVGMGCERHCPEPVLLELLQKALTEAQLSLDDISAISSIDVKADEVGLLALAKQLNKPFYTYSANQLRQVEQQLQNPSDVVFREVGCYGVAEGAALYAATEQAPSHEAELVLPKRKNAQATVAIARAYLDTEASTISASHHYSQNAPLDNLT